MPNFRVQGVPVSKVLILSLLWTLLIYLLIFLKNFVVFGESVSLEVGNIDSDMSILLFFKYMTGGESDSTWV